MRTITHEMEILKMKSDFVSSVSHELKTPLTSIKALTERLLDGKIKKPNKMKEYFSYILRDTDRLSRLVKNVLDFSKIEEGKKEYDFAETNLSQWLIQIIDNFQKENVQSGIEIRKNITNDIPKIQIDQDAMEQVLYNILDNGIKFSSHQKTIEIILSHIGDNCIIKIRDFGIGIPKEELEKIFDKFYQGKYGLQHTVKGTGLGLTLVKHIVEAHQGQIFVESEPGNGSTFTLMFPINKISD